MGKLMIKGVPASGTFDKAENVKFNKENTTGITSGNVQGAIEVLNENKADKTELPTITTTSNTTFTLETSKGGIGVNKVVGKSVKVDDVIYSSGSMGLVDLGSLTWTKFSVTQGNLFRTNIANIKQVDVNTALNAFCSKYNVVSQVNRANKTLSSTATNIDIIDNDYSDTDTFKTSLNGVLLAYELADGATPSQYAEVVEEHGKNLCDMVEFNGVANTIKQTFVSDKLSLKKGKYTLSWTQSETLTSIVRNTPYIQYSDNSKVYQSSSENRNLTSGRYYWTFELTEDNTLNVGYWCHTPNKNVNYTDFMLEEGTVATDYEPYSTNTSIIPLSSPLRSVGDIHDEIDVENKQLIRRVGSVDLGTLTWNYNSSSNYYKSTISDIKSMTNNLYAENYTTVNSSTSVSSMSDKSIKMSGTSGSQDICVKDTSLGTSGKPSGLLAYELATPTTTPLTDEQLNALLSLVSYDGKTYIDTSDIYAKATLDIDYSKSNIGSLALQNENDVVELRQDVDKNTSDISSLNDTTSKLKEWVLVGQKVGAGNISINMDNYTDFLLVGMCASSRSKGTVSIYVPIPLIDDTGTNMVGGKFLTNSDCLGMNVEVKKTNVAIGTYAMCYNSGNVTSTSTFYCYAKLK